MPVEVYEIYTREKMKVITLDFLSRFRLTPRRFEQKPRLQRWLRLDRQRQFPAARKIPYLQNKTKNKTDRSVAFHEVDVLRIPPSLRIRSTNAFLLSDARRSV